MNVTGWLIVILALALLAWELLMLGLDLDHLTISATLRSWGPYWALAIMLGFTLLFWHVWVE